MVAWAAGAKLLGRAGKGFAKTGASKAAKLTSGIFGLGSRMVKGAAPTVGKFVKGAKSQGGRGRVPGGPVGKAGRDTSNIIRGVIPAGKEGAAAAANGLHKLWLSIAAKYPGAAGKAEALRQFALQAPKAFPRNAALVQSAVQLARNTGGSIASLPWIGWGKTALGQGTKAVGQAGAKIPKILARTPQEKAAMGQVVGSVQQAGRKIGSAIKDRIPGGAGIASLAAAGGAKLGRGVSKAGETLRRFNVRGPGPQGTSAEMGGGLGSLLIPAAGKAAPRASGIPGAGVTIPYQVPKGGPMGAGYDVIPKGPAVGDILGQGQARMNAAGAQTGFADYMARARGGAGLGGGAGGAGGAGGGIFGDGTLRGLDRLAGKGLYGLGALALSPLKYPRLLAAGALGTGAYYGLKDDPTPSEQMRKGIYSLTGSQENMGRSLQDLGTLYAAGQIGGALGGRGAEGLSSQLMGNYIGQELFGEEGFPNIPSRGGLNYVGGTPEGIFQNPAKEAIKQRFGNEMMDDEQILQRYSEILDKVRKQKTLDADDINFMMMFEALNKPTNLPTDRFESNAGLLNAMARNDVQNQFGGRFQVIDPNALYPTWQQPRVPINAAYGGAVNGTGSGTSDSIPARLSDGEFVMTADAVRGAGNGNRKDGVRKMYELMNNLEGR